MKNVILGEEGLLAAPSTQGSETLKIHLPLIGWIHFIWHKWDRWAIQMSDEYYIIKYLPPSHGHCMRSQ